MSIVKLESSIASDREDLRIISQGHRIRRAMEADMDQVYRLTHDTLVAAGDIIPLPSGKIVSFPGLDGINETSVLVAECEGRIVGTNSLTLDGPAGLHCDHGFREETNRIRREGRPLASSWRIATSPSFRRGKRLVQDLMVETLRLCLEFELQTCLFVFPPKFESFYQRAIAAETVSRGNISVNGRDLPAVLMRADCERSYSTPFIRGFLDTMNAK
jgi:hypothetical protein